MRSPYKLFPKILLAPALLCGLTSSASATSISATALLTSTPDSSTPGLYDYSITLTNNGTETIGTFWFSWIPGGNFLLTAPTDVNSPPGWNVTAVAGGKSERWTDTGTLLQPGQSLSGFTFQSTETPTQFLGNVASGTGAGDPLLTSYVFEDTYATTSTSGDSLQFVVAQTPEPSALLLTLTGLGTLTATLKRRLKP